MASFFMNADGTIYGRYGTRSKGEKLPGADPDSNSPDVTLAGFGKAAEAALRIHREYEADPASLKAVLAGKNGPDLPWKSANDLPALAAWRKKRGELPGDGVGRGSNGCIHCHNVRTYTIESLRLEGRSVPDAAVWPFPMPDLLGFSLDPSECATVNAVVPGTPAAQAGLRAGDEILRMEGQPLLSVADVQWALHQAPDGSRVAMDITRKGELLKLHLLLPEGWRRDGLIDWRVSMTHMEWKSLGVALVELPEDERKRLGIEAGRTALKVDRVSTEVRNAASRKKGTSGAQDSSGGNNKGWLNGIMKKDVILDVDGISKEVSRTDLLAYVLQKKPRGETLRLTVLRGGTTLTVELPTDITEAAD